MYRILRSTYIHIVFSLSLLCHRRRSYVEKDSTTSGLSIEEYEVYDKRIFFFRVYFSLHFFYIWESCLLPRPPSPLVLRDILSSCSITFMCISYRMFWWHKYDTQIFINKQNALFYSLYVDMNVLLYVLVVGCSSGGFYSVFVMVMWRVGEFYRYFN